MPFMTLHTLYDTAQTLASKEGNKRKKEQEKDNNKPINK